MANKFILAIDQGTTSTRAIVFDVAGKRQATNQREFKQYFPKLGWVEHDAEEIWETTLEVCRAVLAEKNLIAKDIAAIGITNQRETTVIWDKKTGKPIHHAIVWQDRRTADRCRQLISHEATLQEKTGLLMDPYFSATKIVWLLDNVEGARAKAERGELLFGTMDCFLLWRLTGGKRHATDATNASRTALFNIHTQQWDDDLLTLFNIPSGLLPEVCDNSFEFGITKSDLFGGEIPITAMAGDQQAALFGQACFQPGMIKSTYGTGCFLMLNTGEQAIKSENRLLTTVGYRLAMKLEKIALEDKYFVEKKLYPNVDFYSGITLSALGIPTNMFTVIFALARTSGWISHWQEMVSQPYKIGRPRQLYTGPKQRDVK